MIQISLIDSNTCTAARATIRAAEIQAKATKIAGTETLIAGIIALVTSLIAVLVTYFIASSQSKQIEKEQAVKKKAYTTALHALIYNVQTEASFIQEFFEVLSRQEDSCANGEDLIRPEALNLRFHEVARDALAVDRWGDLSNLPDTAIQNAVAAGLAITENILYYSSIQNFLQNRDNNSKIIEYSLLYMEHIVENDEFINDFLCDLKKAAKS